MIQSHQAFEAALEDATALLASNPEEGSAEYKRLFSLMREIADYRPAIIVKEAAATSESERLSRCLDAFESRLPPHFSSHWSSVLGGDLRTAK